MSAYDAVDGAKTLLTKQLDLGTFRNEIDTRVERRSCPIFLHREMSLMALRCTCRVAAQCRLLGDERTC